MKKLFRNIKNFISKARHYIAPALVFVLFLLFVSYAKRSTDAVKCKQLIINITSDHSNQSHLQVSDSVGAGLVVLPGSTASLKSMMRVMSLPSPRSILALG